jgi:hypothetical protein
MPSQASLQRGHVVSIMRQPTPDARQLTCLRGISLRTSSAADCIGSAYRGGVHVASIGAESESLQPIALHITYNIATNSKAGRLTASDARLACLQ